MIKVNEARAEVELIYMHYMTRQGYPCEEIILNIQKMRKDRVSLGRLRGMCLEMVMPLVAQEKEREDVQYD